MIAPSRVREPAHRGFPKIMDHADIKRVIGDYAAAALRLRDSGFDGVEILQNGHLPAISVSGYQLRMMNMAAVLKTACVLSGNRCAKKRDWH